MSWETDRVFTRPCDCEAGIIEITQRSNDWGQFEEWRDIQCPACRAARDAIRKRRVELEEQATSLADERYLTTWLALFEGLNKRKTWFRLTNGHSYPSLGTFYKHVKHEGIDRYLRRFFRNDIAEALSLLGVTDDEISAALNELATLPDYDSRQRRLPH